MDAPPVKANGDRQTPRQTGFVQALRQSRNARSARLWTACNSVSLYRAIIVGHPYRECGCHDGRYRDACARPRAGIYDLANGARRARAMGHRGGSHHRRRTGNRSNQPGQKRTTASRSRSINLFRQNLEVSVRFKPVSGSVDQAGGIAVRLQSPDDYYSFVPMRLKIMCASTAWSKASASNLPVPYQSRYEYLAHIDAESRRRPFYRLL